MPLPTRHTDANRHPPFALFCVASYLLSLSYGSTFLLSLLITSRGGNELDAGRVISVAMLSTLVAVIGSGHITDRLGAARSVALGSVFLIAACLGFAWVPGIGYPLLACGLLLGLGWGLFYTLGPIMVAAMVEPERRTHCFALLSGSMLMGIGSGPLAGYLATRLALPVQTAFLCAGIAAALGGLFFWRMGARSSKATASTAGVASISLGSTWRVLRSRSVFSILLVGLGGAIFGGLGSFQTTYAASMDLPYSLFFVGFMGAAITCRLLIAGWVVKRDPLATSSLLTGLMLLGVLGFGNWVHGSVSYVLTAALLGVGYGLNYSVINGLAANEAPIGLTPQALLLFSLAYFLGVFGFPLVVGNLIVNSGMHGMLTSVSLVALLVWLVSLGRWLVNALGRPRAADIR